ncbi:MAG: hypothetical protein MUF01_04705 [Bryobacterales bacterium]|jgi:hypothetical protein|nr:hypothetical protein [Bryobacterales bacterium]
MKKGTTCSEAIPCITDWRFDEIEEREPDHFRARARIEALRRVIVAYDEPLIRAGVEAHVFFASLFEKLEDAPDNYGLQHVLQAIRDTLDSYELELPAGYWAETARDSWWPDAFDRVRHAIRQNPPAVASDAECPNLQRLGVPVEEVAFYQTAWALFRRDPAAGKCAEPGRLAELICDATDKGNACVEAAAEV